MSVFCMFVFLLLIVRSLQAKSRAHPFQPLCREIGFCFIFLLAAWVPVPMLSSLFQWAASRHYVFHYITPRLVFFRVFLLSKCSVPSSRVGYFCIYILYYIYIPSCFSASAIAMVHTKYYFICHLTMWRECENTRNMIKYHKIQTTKSKIVKRCF